MGVSGWVRSQRRSATEQSMAPSSILGLGRDATRSCGRVNPSEITKPAASPTHENAHHVEPRRAIQARIHDGVGVLRGSSPLGCAVLALHRIIRVLILIES